MKRLTLAAAALLALAGPALAGPTIEGRVSNVRDGDTIDVAGFKGGIRLYGIDAPEKAQRCEDASGKAYLCGSRAADALAALIGRNGRVSCEEMDRDRYGRSVAVCRANGVDLGTRMVELGWAREYARYSDGRYASAEAAARAARAGIWSGTFEDPSDYRAAKRGGGPATTKAPSAPVGAPAGCAIKGNVSSGGKRIYHSPGQRDYDRTVVSQDKGERWFCSGAEAEAAGWTAARR